MIDAATKHLTRWLVLALALMATTPIAWAQTPLAPVPDRAAWELIVQGVQEATPTTEPGADARPAQAPIMKVSCLRWDGVAVDTVQRSDRSASQTVSALGYRFSPAGNGAGVATFQDGGEDVEGLYAPGWFGVGWVAETFATGQAEFTPPGGKPVACLTYHLPAKENPDGEEIPERRAWIDAKSGLPVAVSIGPRTIIFRHLPPPTSPPTLPQQVAATLEDLRAQQERLERLQQRAARQN